jgi:hypothetical protein
MTKNTLNIVRLYDCYVLSQNLNGGVNNELSLKIKKKLDKKIAELKNSEGGFFGWGEEKGKEEKGIGDILSKFNGNIIDGVTNIVADVNKIFNNKEKIAELKQKVTNEGGPQQYLYNQLLIQQNKDDTKKNIIDFINQYKELFISIGFKDEKIDTEQLLKNLESNINTPKK